MAGGCGPRSATGIARAVRLMCRRKLRLRSRGADRVEVVKLSVIIPTRNRAAFLESALDSIAHQDWAKTEFEVIVVDNGSTDSTGDVCGRNACRFAHFARLYASDPGLHVGRHMGMARARADLLVFADDDIEADRGWLRSVFETFQNEDPALVGGPVIPRFEVAPPDWVRRRWQPNALGERVCGHLSLVDLGGQSRVTNPFRVFGCNFSVRKSVVLAAGGFHPDGMPRDLIRFRGDGETHISGYIQRQGLRAFYNTGAAVAHCVPRERLTIEYFCQRSFNQGISESFSDLREGRGGVCGQMASWLRAVARRARLRNAPHPDLLLHRAWRDGYRYHRAEYRRDATLRAWVHRNDYLDPHEGAMFA